MAEQSETERLVTQVFRAWNEAQIESAILDASEESASALRGKRRDSLLASSGGDGENSSSGVGVKLGNRIRVLVANSALGRAEAVMRQTAVEAGFRLHNRAVVGCREFYFSNERGDAQVCITLASRANCERSRLI